MQQISPRDEQLLHQKLPIDANEKILGVYRHHWFAYAASWLVAAVMVVLVLGVAVALTTFGGNDTTIAQYKSQILAGAGVLSVVIAAGASVPVYLRSQEQMVLTEEAVVQMLQPSLLASKVDQLGLQHVTDVSVRQDFLGTVFGYGHITIETPGEQDNYEYDMVPNPQAVAREITQAHENYTAALMGGHLSTTLGSGGSGANQAQAAIDPQQYQQFLAYQQMVAKQQQDQQNQANDPTNSQPPVA